MSSCSHCGTTKATTWTTFERKVVCWECWEKLRKEKILMAGDGIKQTSDFKDWDMGDMSELFWLHLGKYQKNPNKKSLSLMYSAFLWACHADHGLSNSFDNALKWCKIDLFSELQRTDLPNE
jgi:recombinational DNA repair protein (RecF pathway)